MGIYTSAVDILYAEDSPHDAFFALQVMQECNPLLNIHHVHTGEEVLHFLNDGRRELPKLIILDLKMPKVDGFDVLKFIRSHPKAKHHPVVMVSASGLTSDVEEAFRLGVNSYLVKPSNHQEFKETFIMLCEYWFRYDQFSTL